jgi:hypothetical protein
MRIILRSIVAGMWVSAAMLGLAPAFGQAGALDTSFGSGGVVVKSFTGPGFVIPDAIQLQSDGKILVLVQSGNAGDEVLR